jgi:asparagine synthase (glutamine-hydrolysing)
MFPAGYFMEKGKLQRYWSLPSGNKDYPEDDELIDLLKSSVKYRCISDVEVGSYLSGGIDSTLIASLAKKVHSWTVGFNSLNEFEWGKLGAEFIGTSHHEILVEEKDFLNSAKSMIVKRKEPLSVPNEVLLYEMTKEVKNKNTVVLSGEGADELFFGYDRIFSWAHNNQWDLDSFDKLYSYGSHKDHEIIEDVLAPFMNYGDCIDIVAAFFQVAHLHGLLRRLDNATMLCSVEARVPFVDHRLVERMAGVPFEYRFENSISKYPLKRLFRGYFDMLFSNRYSKGTPAILSTNL